MDNSDATIDRKSLITWSMKRLQRQAKEIESNLEFDTAFIEEKTALLPKLTLAKKDVEQQIAERMKRVDHLRITKQMIMLCLELLEKEQKQVQL